MSATGGNSTSSAAAPVATPTKGLSTKAPAFNPSAPAFNPSAPSFTPSSSSAATAPATPAAAPASSSSSAASTSSSSTISSTTAPSSGTKLRVTAKEWTPSPAAATFVPGGGAGAAAGGAASGAAFPVVPASYSPQQQGGGRGGHGMVPPQMGLPGQMLPHYPMGYGGAPMTYAGGPIPVPVYAGYPQMPFMAGQFAGFPTPQHQHQQQMMYQQYMAQQQGFAGHQQLHNAQQQPGKSAPLLTTPQNVPHAQNQQQHSPAITPVPAPATAAAAPSPAAAAAKKDAPSADAKADGKKPADAAAAPAASTAATPAQPAAASTSAAAPAAATAAATPTTANATAKPAAPVSQWGVTAQTARYVRMAAPTEARPLKKPDEEAAPATGAASTVAVTPAAAAAKPAEAAAAKPADAKSAAAPTAAVAAAKKPAAAAQSEAEAESGLAAAAQKATEGGAGKNIRFSLKELLAHRDTDASKLPPPTSVLDAIRGLDLGVDSKSAAAVDPRRRGGAGGDQAPLRPGQGGASSRIPGGGRPGAAPGSAAKGPQDNLRSQFGSSALPARSGNNQGGRDGKKGGGGDRRGGPSAPMDIEIIPLAVTENRYRPLKDVAPDAKLLRQVNSILNKLTPEKFDVLVEQVLALEITSASALRDVVTAVFEKALAEPNYSPVYAEFCVKLAERLPTFAANETDTNKTHNFKRLVLNQCQAEFEASSSSLSAPAAAAPAEEPKPAAAAATTEGDSGASGLPVPAELTEEEKLFKQKRRTLGTIRFIGEMYVRAQLAGKIMKSCIIMLLGDVTRPDEANLEALCKLLETVGKMLDCPADQKLKGVEFMNDTFNLLAELAEPPSKEDSTKTASGKPVLSSRLRFMIQDTIDLRRNDWKQRRKAEVHAKKISDVHKEAARPEPLPSAVRTAPLAVALGTKFGSKGKVDRYASATAAKGGAAAEDEWQMAGGAKGKRSQDVRSGSTLLSRGNSGSSNPPSGAPTPRGAPAQSPQKGGSRRGDGAGAGGAPANLFSAFLGDDEESGAANNNPPPARSGRRQAAAAAEEDEDEEQQEEGEEEEEEQPSAAAAAPSSKSSLSEEEVSKRVHSFIKEYFTSSDFNEVQECIREVGGAEALTDAHWSEGLMIVVDGGKDKERNAYSTLLQLLHEKGLVTREQLATSFRNTLATAEDMGVDFPRMIEHLALLTADLMSSTKSASSGEAKEPIFAVSLLPDFRQVITASEDQRKFALCVLQSLRKALGDEALVAALKQANISKWTQIGDDITPEQSKKLLNDKKLEILADVL